MNGGGVNRVEGRWASRERASWSDIGGNFWDPSTAEVAWEADCLRPWPWNPTKSSCGAVEHPGRPSPQDRTGFRGHAEFPIHSTVAVGRVKIPSPEPRRTAPGKPAGPWFEVWCVPEGAFASRTAPYDESHASTEAMTPAHPRASRPGARRTSPRRNGPARPQPHPSWT